MSNEELLPPTDDGSGPMQQRPPVPTPVPSPPFHEAMAPTLVDLSRQGRGLGDARLNSLVPALFHQLETRNRELKEVAERLGNEKDTVRDRLSEAREALARKDGEIIKLEAEVVRLNQVRKSDRQLTTLAIGTAAFLIPIGYQLLNDKLLVGIGLICFGALAAIVGFFPKVLRIFGVGEQ